MALNINGTTGISGVDGSASAPALQGTDSNTGINFGSDTVNINTGGVTRATVDSSGNLNIPNDSGKIQLGTSSDLQIYHDGSNSYLANTTGNFEIYSNEFRVRSFTASNETMIQGSLHGSVNLFYDNSKKFETSSTGTTTTGNGVLSGLVVAAAGLTQVDNAQSLISQSSIGSSSQTYFIGNASIQVSSDRRIKENIVDTSLNAITELNKVRVVDFTWNDPSDKAINNRNSRGKWTGCIAQEIVDVFPFAVNAPRPEGGEIDHDSEALWGMEYQHLVPVLIKGFQEQQAKIEALEAEKTQMQTDLTALTARVTALEAG